MIQALAIQWNFITNILNWNQLFEQQIHIQNVWNVHWTKFIYKIDVWTGSRRIDWLHYPNKKKPFFFFLIITVSNENINRMNLQKIGIVLNTIDWIKINQRKCSATSVYIHQIGQWFKSNCIWSKWNKFHPPQNRIVEHFSHFEQMHAQ